MKTIFLGKTEYQLVQIDCAIWETGEANKVPELHAEHIGHGHIRYAAIGIDGKRYALTLKRPPLWGSRDESAFDKILALAIHTPLEETSYIRPGCYRTSIGLEMNNISPFREHFNQLLGKKVLVLNDVYEVKGIEAYATGDNYAHSIIGLLLQPV